MCLNIGEVKFEELVKVVSFRLLHYGARIFFYPFVSNLPFAEKHFDVMCIFFALSFALLFLASTNNSLTTASLFYLLVSISQLKISFLVSLFNHCEIMEFYLFSELQSFIILTFLM